MADRRNIQIPDHLKAFLQPNPTGAASLIAAWDGLSAESQICLLEYLNQAQFPTHLVRKICHKALDSPNAYVRYLAARGFFEKDSDSSEDDEDETDEERTLIQQVKQRIELDPDPLVRYCLLENKFIHLRSESEEDLESFFYLPQEVRLAQVRRLRAGGADIARLVEYAVEHKIKDGSVSEIEVVELLLDYLDRDAFKKKYDPDSIGYDGWEEHDKGKALEALWRLVPKTSELISLLLIERLPPHDFSAEIPQEALTGMNDRQLMQLFDRPDIGLEALRRQVFFNDDDNRDGVKWAAVSHHFNLEHEDFARILEKPEKQKVETLESLAGARDLRLCIIEATGDAILLTRQLNTLPSMPHRRFLDGESICSRDLANVATCACVLGCFS